MRVVRLCTRQHPGLDGTGAKLYGARWNSPGRSVVYSASCGALAALEYMVHMTKLPANMLLVRIEVPTLCRWKKLTHCPQMKKCFVNWAMNGSSTAALRFFGFLRFSCHVNGICYSTPSIRSFQPSRSLSRHHSLSTRGCCRRFQHRRS